MNAEPTEITVPVIFGSCFSRSRIPAITSLMSMSRFAGAGGSKFNLHEDALLSIGAALGIFKADAGVGVIESKRCRDGIPKPLCASNEIVVIHEASAQRDQADNHSALARFFAAIVAFRLPSIRLRLGGSHGTQTKHVRVSPLEGFAGMGKVHGLGIAFPSPKHLPTSLLLGHRIDGLDDAPLRPQFAQPREVAVAVHNLAARFKLGQLRCEVQLRFPFHALRDNPTTPHRRQENSSTLYIFPLTT